MTRAPRVSVIIPVFNLGRYVDEAVDSVLAQTFDDYEVLIVDDGSTDVETRRLLEGYRRPRTTVFRTENRGLARARNFLIDRSRGELLCALDADDRLHPEFLLRTVAALDADPGLTFVSAWLQTFGDEDWVWRQERCDLPTLLGECTVLTAALVRKAAVVEAGCYDEAMPHMGDEDWELWLRLVKEGHRGLILPEVLFFYRRRQGSMATTSTRGQIHLELWRYMVEKHADAYRAHATQVLVTRDETLGRLFHEADRLDRELDSGLMALVERRRAELAALQLRLARTRDRRALEERAAALELECARARDEVVALRRSLSWKLAAPLRAGYDALRALRPGKATAKRADV